EAGALAPRLSAEGRFAEDTTPQAVREPGHGASTLSTECDRLAFGSHRAGRGPEETECRLPNTEATPRTLHCRRGFFASIVKVASGPARGIMLLWIAPQRGGSILAAALDSKTHLSLLGRLRHDPSDPGAW